MSSVLCNMLRSEVEWFPVFINKCKRSLFYLDKQCMDHKAMKNVVECTCYREVQSILNESRETTFMEEIWVYKQHERGRQQTLREGLNVSRGG